MKIKTFSSPETAARVLAELQTRADEFGTVEASSPDLAEALDIGQATAYRALARLEDEGRLRILRKGTSGGYPTRWKIEA